MDWKQKLSSRKLWAAIVAFISAILFAFSADPATVEKITGIIMAGASLISYILAEGYVDGKREEGSTVEIGENE